MEQKLTQWRIQSGPFEMARSADMIEKLVSVRQRMAKLNMVDVQRLDDIPGAHVLRLDDGIRFVIQYDICTDRYMGRFDVFGYVPSSMIVVD